MVSIRYKPYWDAVGVLAVCHGYTGVNIILDKNHIKTECKALLDKALAKVDRQFSSRIKLSVPDTVLDVIYSFVYSIEAGAFAK